jgi:hypothetical protein
LLAIPDPYVWRRLAQRWHWRWLAAIIAAQHAAPIRPVLVTNVHYGAQTSDRTFVGTIRRRIESELGFRIANLPAFDGNKASAKLSVVTRQTHTGEQKNAWNDITAPGLVASTDPKVSTTPSSNRFTFTLTASGYRSVSGCGH